MPRQPARIPHSVLVCLAPLLPALASIRAHADDRRLDLSRLSLATFNARFLFDGVQPEGEAPFPWKGDATKARAHLRDIAAILRRVDADIVHLSEVEDLATLKRLLLELGDPTYRAHLVPGKDTFTRQNVGLITRIDPERPLERTDEWAVSPAGGPREGVPKNYGAELAIGELRLFLIGAHLLAIPDDLARAPRREGQAEALRRFAEERGTRRGRFTVILGDLNDFDPEVPDAAGSVPITQVLPLLRGVAANEVGDDLMNPALLLPEAERFTGFFDRDADGIDDGAVERSLTDHILLPRALANAIAAVEVLDDHDPFGPSDHFPLKVTLALDRLRLFRRGDADGDGRRDAADALAVLAHLFQGTPVPCADAADVDDDGRLDLTDAIALLSFLHGRGPPPPPPGPLLPGEDATADELAPCSVTRDSPW
jgi:endonuclease/exonuclease/phosphatase family metal-dependent hydrolase